MTDQLREAWGDMLAAFEQARDAIDDPKLYPPPPSDRVLAEGYRYLAGWMFGGIERAFLSDPEFPYFRRAIQPMDKATIDNADGLYLCADIDGTQSYRISGRIVDGAPPQYFIFEATTAYAGDSGSLAELAPGGRYNTGRIDSTELVTDADGSFEILLAPSRPDGYEGNFICSRREREGAMQTSRFVVLRELFHDWDHEQPLDVAIHRIGGEGSHPAALDADGAARRLRRVGEIVRNQMLFWNEFYAVVLEAHEDMNGDGKRFMPRNAFNEPAGANLATGGGQSTNVYAGGVYELGPEEALVVEVRTPVAADYQGFHLSNLWGESLDYANHQSSLNVHQAEPDDDGEGDDGEGVLRYVVAHRDPGVPNWVDTTGLPEGFMAQRWTYADTPAEMPTIAATVVPFDAVRDHLPASTRTVFPDERRRTIHARQRHVQRRYRQY
jgi:hypothetical protein